VDAFDAVRRSAAELHDAAVARGADPLDVSTIVEKAADELDVKIQGVPSGNVALHGALALFDPQSRLVCYGDSNDATQRALLVGHELGHARLHAVASSCQEHDVDADASIEPTPVGLERVTDYGARERRELHANVFARELLLPRSLARRLYLKDRLSSALIAERTALPLTMVRQQLLDALLLPMPPVEGQKRRLVEPEPDASQQAAAQHYGSAYNLQAGPGTGKTRTLIERVKWLIAQGVDPTSVLVLTFSNRAAGELAERFSAAVPNEAPRIWTGTFHAFGLDLVRRFHDRFDLSNDPRLFDRSDAIAALQEVLPTLPLRHYQNLWRPALPLRDILAAISRAKDELVDSRRYRELATAMLAEAQDDAARETAEKCCEIAEVYDRYDEVLRQRDAVDFGDLIMRPTLLLESDEALRAQLAERHRNVLVDEYQDVNRASGRLLKALAGNAERLWVVGDARQSIYRFRGASPSNLLLFNAEFGGEAGALAVNSVKLLTLSKE
jgi:DNA helicase II / ATP-dependent DNA helicase PcrA